LSLSRVYGRAAGLLTRPQTQSRGAVPLLRARYIRSAAARRARLGLGTGPPAKQSVLRTQGYRSPSPQHEDCHVQPHRHRQRDVTRRRYGGFLAFPSAGSLGAARAPAAWFAAGGDGMKDEEADSRAINAQPWEPLPGMLKRQCPECRYYFAAPIVAAAALAGGMSLKRKDRRPSRERHGA
jgi:hypothetical protein